MGISRSAGRRGVSLIELLVVITIIAVLISILLPTLSGVRQRARQLRCLSHLQQINEAMSVYATDFRGSFPVMPTPAGLPPMESQSIYGGFAGLFSLEQRGDGVHLGFGGGTPGGGAYSNGQTSPLMETYLSSLAALVCPSDREDRYYGMPYTPQGNLSYAAADPVRPRAPGRTTEVVSYNISYVFIAGLTLENSENMLLVEETNGPDLGGAWAWYGGGPGHPGGLTPNAAAAGATGSQRYAPVDNHGSAGGNMVSAQGQGRWAERPPGLGIVEGRQQRFIMD